MSWHDNYIYFLKKNAYLIIVMFCWILQLVCWKNSSYLVWTKSFETVFPHHESKTQWKLTYLFYDVQKHHLKHKNSVRSFFAIMACGISLVVAATQYVSHFQHTFDHLFSSSFNTNRKRASIKEKKLPSLLLSGFTLKNSEHNCTKRALDFLFFRLFLKIIK